MSNPFNEFINGLRVLDEIPEAPEQPESTDPVETPEVAAMRDAIQHHTTAIAFVFPTGLDGETVGVAVANSSAQSAFVNLPDAEITLTPEQSRDPRLQLAMLIAIRKRIDTLAMEVSAKLTGKTDFLIAHRIECPHGPDCPSEKMLNQMGE